MDPSLLAKLNFRYGLNYKNKGTKKVIYKRRNKIKNNDVIKLSEII